jgi:rhodanese-related sulfurtransferase
MVAKFGLVLAFTLFAAGLASAAEKRITADTAYDRLSKGQLTLIDIRSPEEWRESGVPAGALAITMHDPGGKAAFAKAILRAVGGDKTKPIALICAVGRRSRWAQGFLANQGHVQVQDVSEGMFGRGKHLPGWVRRGLPVKPCLRC